MARSGFQGALFAACLTGACGAAGAGAAQNALPSRQELDPGRTRALAAAPAGEAFAGIESGPCPFGESALTFTLQGVDIRAADAAASLSTVELSPAWSGFLGREISLSTACEIRDRVAATYLRRGVLASVIIPEQRIVEGRLALEVVEARVTSVSYRGDAGPAQAQVARYLDQLKGMAPFDLNRAQRYLLLASDIPGVQVQATLKPAPGGAGAVALEIAVSHDPVSVFLEAHNLGSVSVGREMLLARVDLNSLTPLGERTSLIAYGTADFEEQRVFQLIEQIKLGGSGLAAELSASWAETRPGGALSALELDGESFAGSARLSLPLVRHRRHNLTASAGLDWIDQTMEFGNGIAVLTEDHLRVAYARLDGHWAPRSLAGNSAAVTGFAEVRQGLSGLGASDYGDILASRFLGVPDALIWRAEMQLGARLAGPLIGAATVSWQHTDDPLLAYEEFSVGNLGVGRGYDPSAASGDRAIAWSLELTTTPLRTPWGRAWRPYVFFDTAQLTNVGPGEDRMVLSSAGAGVRAQMTDRVAVDLAWAEPFDSPTGAGDAPPSRVLVTLSAALF
jgi:hemolysin activation/secretion protein